ncbi:ABC transporter ATP-binding protein [Nocardioides caldifontis]|uniref:ABC transporter ATP-binding protein n=1 Tax=Nocardioides caldifontis TaxID=2588938 RepID=UPI0011DF3DA8|nr:ATP-binding cassette domain-containing protein [Nocardioides caldifontis]
MELLRLTGVEVRYGGFAALDGVDLEVGPRQVVGVVGTNGAGKSTLCDVVSGYVRPAAGEVCWQGRDVTGLGPRERHRLGVGRTLQGLGLLEDVTVRTNVELGASRHAREGRGLLSRVTTVDREVTARVDAVLSDLRITEHAEALPPSLPHAVRARVALARALVGLPSLLVLDEPTTGLSVEEATRFGTLLRRIAGRTSVLLVDHHLELLTSVSDELVVLDAGRVVARTTPDEVAARPELLAPYTS